MRVRVLRAISSNLKKCRTTRKCLDEGSERDGVRRKAYACTNRLCAHQDADGQDTARWTYTIRERSRDASYLTGVGKQGAAAYEL